MGIEPRIAQGSPRGLTVLEGRIARNRRGSVTVAVTSQLCAPKKGVVEGESLALRCIAIIADASRRLRGSTTPSEKPTMILEGRRRLLKHA